ncbi:copper resistance protein CopD [Nakamurella silvestris]|nr:copper resistance protein CopD [Nakamurella silvestris]
MFAALLAAAALVATLVGSAVTMQPPSIGVDEPSFVIRYGIPVVRTLLDISVVATVGFALLAKFLGFDRPDRTEPVMVPVRRWAVWTSWVWTVSALLAIVLLAAEIESGVPSPAQVWSFIGNIPAGKGLLISAGAGLLSVWICRVSLRQGERVPAELRAGIALLGLLPLPLTGHASNWYWHDFTMMSMELHVVGSSAWAGGLGAVILLLWRRPALLAVALPRFSKLATICVILVGVTGVFNGLVELALSPVADLPESLWQTRYGVLVLAKAVLMVVVAALAAHVRFKLLPKIKAGRKAAVALWCGWELIVLSLAFGVAVVLTRTSVVPF